MLKIYKTEQLSLDEAKASSRKLREAGKRLVIVLFWQRYAIAKRSWIKRKVEKNISNG